MFFHICTYALSKMLKLNSFAKKLVNEVPSIDVCDVKYATELIRELKINSHKEMTSSLTGERLRDKSRI